MQVRAFDNGGYASVCYLVTDDKRTAAVVVDPSLSPATVRMLLGDTLPPVTAILLTHGHFDHMLELDAWRLQTRAPVCVMAADAANLTSPWLSCYRLFLRSEQTHAAPERRLYDGDTVDVGEERLTVLATPGHTPGSCVFLGDGFVLTGDTLFADGGYGRFDLPGGDMDALRTSIAKLFALPDDPILYPGHGGATRLSAERRYHTWNF